MGVRPSEHIQESCVALHTKCLLPNSSLGFYPRTRLIPQKCQILPWLAIILWKYQVCGEIQLAVTAYGVTGVHDNRKRWICEWRRCKKCKEKYNWWFFSVPCFSLDASCACPVEGLKALVCLENMWQQDVIASDICFCTKTQAYYMLVCFNGTLGLLSQWALPVYHPEGVAWVQNVMNIYVFCCFPLLS